MKKREKLTVFNILLSVFIGFSCGYTIGNIIIIPILKMLNIL